MARKLPKSFMATPEEDEFFAKEKAASKVEDEAVEEETAPEEETPEEEPVAESEESVEEETTEEVEQEETAEPEEKPSRTVPIGALHEEREKRRQLQAKIEQMEATFQKMVERVGQQQPQQQLPVAPEPQIPAYDEDPVAHLKARIDQLTQLSTGTHQQIQQQHAMSKFVEALGTLENQIRTTTSDYDAAIDFAKRSRDAELAALGYAPEARAEMMRQEILGTAAYCMQRGQNPAEAFYNYAKVRGWQGTNGAPKPAPAPVQAARKLATVAKAQGAGKALPRGGSAPPAVRSLEDLATMEDKDFDKFFDSVMRKS